MKSLLSAIVLSGLFSVAALANEATVKETKEVKEILSTSSRDRVTDVDEEKHTETFVLLKHKTEINKYYTMRAQKEYTEKKVFNMKRNYNVILKYPCCPNTMMLNNQVKKELKKMGWADINYNDFTLNEGFTQQDLINTYNKVYDSRLINIYFFLFTY